MSESKENVATFTVKGTVLEIKEPVSGQNSEGKQWSRQEFILDRGIKYDSELCIQLGNAQKIQDAKGIIDKGAIVEVTFSVSSNNWKGQGKWFTNVKYVSATRVQNTI